MEVRVNSRKKILKSFLGWLPLALASLVFYGAIIVVLIMWIFTNFFGFEQTLARQIGWVLGGMLLVVLTYVYLNWIANSLYSYRLSIENDKLLIRGKAGWKSLNKEVSVNTIQKIYLGQNASAAETLSSGHGAIQDQVASRLTFYPISGKPFKLDFATKAFDNNSLCEFLVFIKTKGVETNISV